MSQRIDLAPGTRLASLLQAHRVAALPDRALEPQAGL
jgi:hypothetical protein